MAKHYIRLNENNMIIRGFSSDFEQPLDTDICINENGGRHFAFKLGDGSEGSPNPNLISELGCFMYKYEDGQVMQITEAEIKSSNEYKVIQHDSLKAACSSDIAAMGEAKAQTLAMKKYMGGVLTEEEVQFVDTFLAARDARLAQYEADKLALGI